MRLIVSHFVAAFALLFLMTSAADAARVDMSAFVNGTPYAGQALQVGNQVEIRAFLDTETTTNITLLGVGILFNSASVSYNQAASSSTTYLLYLNSKSPYLVAASTCGGSAGTGCNIFPTRANQVQLDFLSSSLPGGVPATTATDTSTAGGPRLVSLIFDVTNTAAGTATFSFDFDPFFGSILQIDPPANPPLGLGPNVVINLPEPGVAALSLTALGALTVLRRRRAA